MVVNQLTEEAQQGDTWRPLVIEGSLTGNNLFIFVIIIVIIVFEWTPSPSYISWKPFVNAMNAVNESFIDSRYSRQ